MSLGILLFGFAADLDELADALGKGDAGAVRPFADLGEGLVVKADGDPPHGDFGNRVAAGTAPPLLIDPRHPSGRRRQKGYPDGRQPVPQPRRREGDIGAKGDAPAVPAGARPGGRQRRGNGDRFRRAH